jgi:SAM-dependent methyltransferase
MNPYLNPKLSIDFPHYVIRKSILHCIKNYLPEFTGTVVDLGCGNMPYKELVLSQSNVEKYIGVDLEQREFYNEVPDLIWNGIEIPLAENSVDIILFTEVIEHLAEAVLVCKEINRVLKKGGKLIGTTPFFWPIHEAPNDRQRFTPFGLQNTLKDAGFNEIEIIAAGGWKVSLAQFLSVYAGFGIRNKFLKNSTTAVFYFPVLWLSSHIRTIKSFQNKIMINMLCFKAVK